MGICPDEPFPPAAKPVPPAPGIVAGPHRCILALDLGTTTGWAVRRRDGSIVHGSTSFAPRSGWGPGQRWLRFRGFLQDLIAAEKPDRIAYEEVMNHVSVYAGHAYGAFEALVQMVADGHRLPMELYGVGVIKKAWACWGDVSKDGMIAEARRRGFRPQDDNAADGLAILNVATIKESGTGIGIGADVGQADPAKVLRRERTPRPAKAGGKPEARKAKPKAPAQRSLLGAGA